ncbi:MAG: hypothetical protein M3Q49_03770 [Actinomycetota bacterium]|nr:hypothetical protein [Actinomycetota bacterium]
MALVGLVGPELVGPELVGPELVGISFSRENSCGTGRDAPGGPELVPERLELVPELVPELVRDRSGRGPRRRPRGPERASSRLVGTGRGGPERLELVGDRGRSSWGPVGTR